MALMPVDPELRERLGLSGAAELLQTFTQGGLDIIEGDYLVIGTTEYPVRSVGDWPWRPDGTDNRLHIVVEQVKTG